MSSIEIWAPRWHDRKVLVAKHKVGEHNTISLTKAKSLPGNYYIAGVKAKQFPVESNGRISCYAIPLDELELVE